MIFLIHINNPAAIPIVNSIHEILNNFESCILQSPFWKLLFYAADSL